MLRRVRIYLAFVRTELSNLAQFRTNALAWCLYSPLQMAILYVVWKIVYAGRATVGSFDFAGMLLYYLVVHYLRRVIEPVQSVNYQVWSEINEGRLDTYLARPVSFGLVTFSRSLAGPLLELALGVPFFLLFSLALSLPVQTDPLRLGAFFVSVSGGYIILFLVQFLIGSLSFWFERIFGLRDIVFSVFMLFSGQIIPVSLLPDWAGRMSQWLPFAGIYYAPAMIYTPAGDLTSMGTFLGTQALWIGVLLVLATGVWSRGVRRYASQGG